MNLKSFSTRNTILLIWVFEVSARQFGKNDGNLVPGTGLSLPNIPQPRIVGGQDANDNEYPYQVSLRLFNGHICGASIISDNYALTAAHCVSSGPGNSIRKTSTSLLSIRAGSRTVNSGGEIVGVSEVIIHPNYKNFNNDIAVLKFKTPLDFNKSMQPIVLASQNPKIGTKVITTGWGRLRTNGASPDILQFNTLVAISTAECRRRIGYVPISTLCLGHAAGNGVCSGDSGGPAVHNNQLVGVTNFVVGGCGSNSPDGYASVAFFAKWIRSVTNLR